MKIKFFSGFSPICSVGFVKTCRIHVQTAGGRIRVSTPFESDFVERCLDVLGQNQTTNPISSPIRHNFKHSKSSRSLLTYSGGLLW